MTLPWALFEICINAIQCALTLYFGVRVFDLKKQYTNEARYVVPLWALATFCLSLFTFFRIPSWIPDILPSIIIFLMLTGIFYEGSFLYKVLCCGAYFLVCGFLTIIIQVLTLRVYDVPSEQLFAQTPARLIHMIIIAALTIPLTLLMIRLARAIIRKRSIPRSTYGIYVVFVALPFMSLLILLIMLRTVVIVPEEYISRMNTDIAAFVLLLINILVIWIFDHVNKQNENVLALEREKQQMTFQLQHYIDIEKIYKDMLQWEHDKSKHLQTLLALMEMMEYEKAKMYLKELVEHYDSFIINYKTGNLTMDALVNAMGALLSQDMIDFEVNLVLPDVLSVSNNDLTIIVGNLLENARTACIEIDDPSLRKIRLVGQVRNMTLEMQLVNSRNPRIKEKGFRGLSTKFRVSHQGIGLSIIEKRLDVYSGYIAYVEDDDMFRVDLIIPIQ